MAVNTTGGEARLGVGRTVARPRPRIGDPEYWANLRYMTFGRAVPAVLFGFMGWLQYRHLADNLPLVSLRHTVEDVLPRALYLAFCAIPVAIYLTRPRPQRSDRRFLPRSVAFVATTMQLVLGAFAPNTPTLFTPPAWFSDVSGLLLLGALAFAVWGLSFLRRSLSIVPEARRLTTSGPYRIVRHPLYLGEITAAFALVLTAPRMLSVASVLALVALQLIRTFYEEALLTSVFPEYEAYSHRTARLIPFVL